MENIQVILSIASTALGLLIMVITFILKFVKSEKAKVTLQKIQEISGALLPLIEEAETITTLTGEEKKNYVLEKIKQFAIDNNIEYDEVLFDNKIEELISLTKKVNAK